MGSEPGEVRTEEDMCAELASFERARVLDLGCGRADATRKLAASFPQARFTALETDAIQAKLNRESEVPPNLAFGEGVAQSIAAGDGAFDIVVMFKSLHHVPLASLDAALAEIRRVLAPGGRALFFEPVFAGEYNEIMRIFHDEERVRAAAFAALSRAVDSGQWTLVEERFFQRRVAFKSFEHFEKAVIGVTHTQHRLGDDQLARVRERYGRNAKEGAAQFLGPMRVDVLAPAA